jgi:hypothetical protein
MEQEQDMGNTTEHTLEKTPQKPRLMVLTDIGGDPDDQQSMIRLMLYACDFEIEGLVASASGTPGELDQDMVRPDLIEQIVRAYGNVRDKLIQHRDGYPETGALLDRIKSGNPHRGFDSLGQDADTEGSEWIRQAALREDARPLNVVIWGGSTDLAQALWRLSDTLEPEALATVLRRLRVHSIGHQDETGPWIVRTFPELFYVLSMAEPGQDKREGAYRGMYLDGDESLTSPDWLQEHVLTGHGPLGALYPMATWTAPNPHVALKEGDTPSWFYFLPNGLGSPDHPEWGCWGGRFRPAGNRLFRDAADRVGGVTHARATVWRWRPDFQSEFQARMDWCVASPAEANHPPQALVRGPARRMVRSMDWVALDGSGSGDSDGDELAYDWFVYPEAGSCRGEVDLWGATSKVAALHVPEVEAPQTVHLVLRVVDSGEPPLASYARVVLTVLPRPE